MIIKNDFEEKIDKIAKTVVIGKSMEEFYTTLHAAEQQVEIESFKESIHTLKITLGIATILGVITFYIKQGGFPP